MEEVVDEEDENGGDDEGKVATEAPTGEVVGVGRSSRWSVAEHRGIGGGGDEVRGIGFIIVFITVTLFLFAVAAVYDGSGEGAVSAACHWGMVVD